MLFRTVFLKTHKKTLLTAKNSECGDYDYQELWLLDLFYPIKTNFHTPPYIGLCSQVLGFHFSQLGNCQMGF